MSTIAIIPARGGSRRIPGKNIKLFEGKPIIVYSIQAAIVTELFDRIIVSTDDELIAHTARSNGAEVWYRKDSYCCDDVGTQEVVKECLIGIGAKSYDYACCIYATAPLMHPADLYNGYAMFADSSSHSYVMSVGYPPLQDAAQFYWGMACNFMRNIPLISPYTRMVLIDPERVCDINTPADWKRAVKMYRSLPSECLYRHHRS